MATGSFTANFGVGWDINGVPNGGYSGLLGTLAMREESGRADPLTVTGHYLRPTAPGPVEIAVQTVKRGRLMTFMTAILVQNGKEVIRMTGSFGELSAMDGPNRQTLDAPPMPAPEDCVTRPAGPGEGTPPPFFDKVHCVMPAEHTSYPDGPDNHESPEHESPEAVVHGWIRHLDQPTTIADLFLFADAFPPPIFRTGSGSSWVPTIELTVHFRSRPTTDWIVARMTSPSIQGGLQTEDGILWDANGNLVAQSRQLAMAR